MMGKTGPIGVEGHRAAPAGGQYDLERIFECLPVMDPRTAECSMYLSKIDDPPRTRLLDVGFSAPRAGTFARTRIGRGWPSVGPRPPAADLL